MASSCSPGGTDRATFQTTFSGRVNTGAQIGSNSGMINNNFYASAPFQSLSPSIAIPFTRDRNFIDRPVLEDILERALEPAARVGIVGLGGVGKTQLAIEYAYRRREADRNLWIFWVHASSSTRVEESYRSIARQLKLSGCDDPQVDVLSSVHMWLNDEEHGKWTMIVDNADDGDIIYGTPTEDTATPSDSATPAAGNTFSVKRVLVDYLPSSQHGSIIITSRNRKVVEGLTEHVDDIVDIEPMTTEESVGLLMSKLGRQLQNVDRNEAVRLVQELDHMPLAIAQAAGFINQQFPRMTLSQYLNTISKDDIGRASMLRKDIRNPRRDGSASNSILITWYTSFERIRQTQRSAADLLALMSMFDREGVSESLLEGKYSPKDDEAELGQHNNVTIDFEEDITLLRSYSLIGIGSSHTVFNMHRLVQCSARTWLEAHHELENWQERCITILNDRFPGGNYENWSRCQLLFPHVQATLSYIVENRECRLDHAALLYRTAWYAAEVGLCDIAEEMAQASSKTRTEILGQNAPQTLNSLSVLAIVSRRQTNYTRAEELSRQILIVYENDLGPNHPSTLLFVSNLGLVLDNQGKYKEAEQLLRRAFEGREQALGPSHRDTLVSAHNLATVLYKQDQNEEMDELFQQALQGREKVLGPSHPDTLKTVWMMATTSTGRREDPEVLDLYNRACEGLVSAFGPSHPDTLTCQRERAEFISEMNASSSSI